MIIGLFLGQLLFNFIILTVETDIVMFGEDDLLAELHLLLSAYDRFHIYCQLVNDSGHQPGGYGRSAQEQRIDEEPEGLRTKRAAVMPVQGKIRPQMIKIWRL